MIDKVTQKLAAVVRLRQRPPAQDTDELAALERGYRELAADLKVRMVELEAERRRLRGANERFGEALATTLDAEQLRHVILESAVEATHAAGGLLITEDGDAIETGDPDPGFERIEFELRAGRRDFGRLVLLAKQFDPEARMTAAVLVGQAVIALDNARLHRIVERQAMVDDLTGLANRRHATEMLRRELARSQRFGGPVGLILADVDDFKAINDEYRPPDRGRRPSRGRRRAPGDRSRDRHSGSLGRRGVRDRAAGNRRRRRDLRRGTRSRRACEARHPWSGRRSAARDGELRRRVRESPERRARSSSHWRTRRSTAPSARARTASTRASRWCPACSETRKSRRKSSGECATIGPLLEPPNGPVPDQGAHTCRLRPPRTLHA